MRTLAGQQGARGSALITTLLVVVVLTIIVTAFLQSMTVEQQTARSYLNRFRAELATEAALTQATSHLSDFMVKYPYHAIAYDDEQTDEVLPIFFGAANMASMPQTPDANQEATRYLISGTENDGRTLPEMTPQNSVAINGEREGEPGWMGSPLTPAGAIDHRDCRALWVYLLQDASLPHQPDSSQPEYNPYVARFAWWVEDETSKIDLLRAGNDEESGGFKPPEQKNLAVSGDTSFEDAVAWRPEDIDVGAIPIKFGQPLAEDDTTSNQELISFLHPLANAPKDARILDQVPGFGGDTADDGSEARARFYTTLSSVSSELAGNGRRRVNINALVHDQAAVTPLKNDLDDIAYAITGKHIFPGAGGFFGGEPDGDDKALLPDFGQRFWPSRDDSPQVRSNAEPKETIYMMKLAANIRDYIDSDANPTFVDANNEIIVGDIDRDDYFQPGVFPNLTHNMKMPRAIGQEALPYLAKVGFAVNYKDSTIGVYEVFSFYNPATKDFVAPEGTFLRCFDRLRWTPTGKLGNVQMPAYRLDLSGLTFPAGKMTVISTGRSNDATTEPRSYMTGVTPWRPFDVNPPAMTPPDANSVKVDGATGFIPFQRDNSYDVSTKIVWGNSLGYYGGFPAVTLTNFVAGGNEANPQNYRMNDKNSSEARANSMRGNDSTSSSGDPRSINEPLTFNKTAAGYGGGAAQDAARFWDDPGLKLGEASNTYIDPTAWPDWTRPLTNNGTTSYAVIRDQPMTSIGELANIYDPYRRRGGSGMIDYARAGGRTLRIGQPDDVTVDARNGVKGNNGAVYDDLRMAARVPTNRFTPTWANSAWRLTDIFDVILREDTSPAGQPDLTTRLVPPQATGKLNINSVKRDGGAALKTLLRGFQFLEGDAPSGSTYSDTKLSNQELSEEDIERIITSVKNYLDNRGPIVERGEISNLLEGEQPLFSAKTARLANQSMGEVQDRGREEILRRLIGMLTTRSNSFTVYAVGQAIKEQRSPGGSGGYYNQILSTTTKATTYRFDPVILSATGSDIPDSNPSATPTSYVVTPLYNRP